MDLRAAFETALALNRAAFAAGHLAVARPALETTLVCADALDDKSLLRTVAPVPGHRQGGY